MRKFVNLKRRLHRKGAVISEIFQNGAYFSLRGGAQDISVVLSPPKCGGSTLKRTIQAAVPHQIVGHVHVLSADGMSVFVEDYDEMVSDGLDLLADAYVRHIKLANSLQSQIRNLGRAKIICSIREPISLAMSFFFQNFEYYRAAGLDVSSKAVKTYVEEKCFSAGLLKGGLDGWFNREIIPLVGNGSVAGLNRESDRAEIRFEKDGIELLIFRLEDFSSVSKQLSDFYKLPTPCFKVMNENIGASKVYSRAYAQAKDTVRFSSKFLDEVYSGQVVKKLYNDDEIERFRARWGER